MSLLSLEIKLRVTRRAFDREQPQLRRDAAMRRESSGPARGRKHAMTRDDDRERVTTESLPDGASGARVAEFRGDLAIGPASRRAEWRGRSRTRGGRIPARPAMSSSIESRSGDPPSRCATIRTIASPIGAGGTPSIASGNRRSSRARSAPAGSGSWTPTIPRGPQATPQRPIGVSNSVTWARSLGVGTPAIIVEPDVVQNATVDKERRAFTTIQNSSEPLRTSAPHFGKLRLRRRRTCVGRNPSTTGVQQ